VTANVSTADANATVAVALVTNQTTKNSTSNVSTVAPQSSQEDNTYGFLQNYALKQEITA